MCGVPARFPKSCKGGLYCIRAGELLRHRLRPPRRCLRPRSQLRPLTLSRPLDRYFSIRTRHRGLGLVPSSSGTLTRPVHSPVRPHRSVREHAIQQASLDLFRASLVHDRIPHPHIAGCDSTVHQAPAGMTPATIDRSQNPDKALDIRVLPLAVARSGLLPTCCSL
jgi:hypothetical protein